MQIGMVGLGRMGGNMTKRLLQRGHEVAAFDRNASAVQAAEADGAIGASSMQDLVAELKPPRAVWIMVPAGPPTDATVAALAGLLEQGDAIVDGGNSNFRHAMEVSAQLKQERGIDFIDAGTSGGIWGLSNGYCLMVGGDTGAVSRLEPIFTALAPEGGYAHVGPSGAGHFTKMVHNGIEYGMLQAYAEGFALLDAAPEFNLDLREIAAIWRYGSVVRSWLLELAVLALEDTEGFQHVRGYVEDSGEGRWTVKEAVDRGVPAPVITASLYERFASRDDNLFANRIIAALRGQFGGHKLFSEAPASDAARSAQASGSTQG